MDKDKLLARQTELIKIIEAIDGVLNNRDWHVLRGEFEKRAGVLERQMLAEAKKSEIEAEKLYFLQGQLAETKRFDLPNWADKLKKELQGNKINLQ